MKITKSLALAAGLVIGGLNVSGQTTTPEQAAQRETTEMKTYVTGITPDEEGQILTVEQTHSKGLMDVQTTVTDEATMKTDKKQLWDARHTQIKAILTEDQFKEYVKVEKIEKHQIHHNNRWAPAYYVEMP